MLTLRDILLGGVLPGVVTLLVLAIGWAAWRRGERPRAAWAAPLAIALGFAAGWIGLSSGHRVPGLPPRLGQEWLFYLALAAGAIGVILAFARAHWSIGIVLAAIFSAAAAYLLISRLPRIYSNGGLPLVAMAAGGVVGWIVLTDLFAARAGRVHATLPLAILTMLVSVIVMLCGSQTIGQYVGIAAATAVAAAIVAAISPGASFRHGAAALAAITGAVLIVARFYISPPMPLLYLGLIALTPLLLLLSTLPTLSRKPRRRLLAAALALVPPAIALVLAILAFIEASRSRGPSYYY
jgi:hypothetical protein